MTDTDLLDRLWRRLVVDAETGCWLWEDFRAAGHPNANKTHCPQNHPYDSQTGGGRICRICRNESNRRYYLRKKAQ